MTEQDHGGNPYDYRAHDSIWKRVRPDLTPFPEAETNGGEAPLISAEERAAQLRLPGAEANACCLGSSATESLQVISGFMRAEMASFCFERALACRAPNGRERATMERLARGGEEIFRRLSAVYFLITGAFPCMEKEPRTGGVPCWTEGLRSAYHAEVCGAINYRRAADGVTDLCLIRIFGNLGERKSDRADTLMQLVVNCKRTRP